MLVLGVFIGAFVQDNLAPKQIERTTIYRTIKYPICVAVESESDVCKREMKDAEQTYLKDLGSRA